MAAEWYHVAACDIIVTAWNSVLQPAFSRSSIVQAFNKELCSRTGIWFSPLTMEGKVWLNFASRANNWSRCFMVIGEVWVKLWLTQLSKCHYWKCSKNFAFACLSISCFLYFLQTVTLLEYLNGECYSTILCLGMVSKLIFSFTIILHIFLLRLFLFFRKQFNSPSLHGSGQ